MYEEAINESIRRNKRKMMLLEAKPYVQKIWEIYLDTKQKEEKELFPYDKFEDFLKDCNLV